MFEPTAPRLHMLRHAPASAECPSPRLGEAPDPVRRVRHCWSHGGQRLRLQTGAVLDRVVQVEFVGVGTLAQGVDFSLFQVDPGGQQVSCENISGQ